jgi:hypothetical protein
MEPSIHDAPKLSFVSLVRTMDSAIGLCEGALAVGDPLQKRRCASLADQIYARVFRLMGRISLDQEQVVAFESKSMQLESLMGKLTSELDRVASEVRTEAE